MTYTGTKGATRAAAVLAFAAILGLTACGPSTSNYPGRPTGQGPNNPTGEQQRESIFGEDGLTLFGGSSKDAVEGSGIGVNSFLWRASLDTIAFMPLTSADPFGGVIITDWYQDPKTPGERFKVTVYILDRRLRADGVKVAVFRQTRSDKGEWIDAAVAGNTPLQIENAILVRARQLRISTIEATERR
ncbi:MAG: DUF3576 domain-containing protein [Parvibaculum sp.]|uniref:DUF3576 domain-containing protein n=1 Tax=Parvibaculum sp. TaxID=2024848 RepID=UPI00271CF233|nr:DUF3576 domain-containing protein [Parvibaculum sp.]MDO8837587.1 DUF3576 domain-containing protein [Parvibaculum sp.]